MEVVNTYQTRPQSSSIHGGDERTFAIFAHLAAIIAMIVSAGWLTFIGPLLVWIFARNRSDFVRQAAAGAFNFNIWAWLISIVAWICLFTVILSPVAVVLWIISGIMTLWCSIKGAVLAARGEFYRYPAQLKLLH